MPSFHYIALNQEDLELTGVIEATNEPAARTKLNELGLSVISLNQGDSSNLKKSAPAPAATTQMMVFEFEAFDQNKKKVIGTIRAENLVKAYARLIGEYQLGVLSLVDSSLSATDKEAQKNAGIVAIQEEYDLLSGKKKERDEEAQALSQGFERQRRDLFEKIDFTMRRVETFLKTYGTELKPEEKDVIRSYINQLIRIKDSTNLEHIRSTCERMLTHLQTQEVFINEGKRLKESAKLKVETHELLKQLKSAGLKQDINIADLASRTAGQWQGNRILKPVANFILKIFPPINPDIRRLKEEIKNVNGQIWSYIKMTLTGSSKVVRMESFNSIRTLFEEKKRLKLEIQAIKQKLAPALDAESASASFWDTTRNTLGWLLSFYLLSYFLSYPFTIKSLFVSNLPQPFYFYESTVTKAAALFLFIIYGVTTIATFWLRRHRAALYLLYPASFFVFLLIAVNLL